MAKNLENKANNKGFTLVELIVVIVILAILAAILVPALLGYIDRAKGSQVLLNGKSMLTAAQAEASNAYGICPDDKTTADMMTADRLQTIADTADTPGTASFSMKAASAKATKDDHDSWTIGKLWYTENGITVYYDGESWENPSTHTISGTYSVPVRKTK